RQLSVMNTDLEHLKLMEMLPVFRGKDVGVGVTDSHAHFIGKVEDVENSIRRTLKLFPPERLWIYPECGLKTRTTDEAEAKLQVMVDAVRDIKRELEIE